MNGHQLIDDLAEALTIEIKIQEKWGNLVKKCDLEVQ